MFKDQLWKNMEAYMDIYDDKKQYSSWTMLKAWGKCFKSSKGMGTRLNPKKYVFGVTLRKFLEYLILASGIEANLCKIQELISMRPPSNLKGIQQLNGRIVALNIFISKCTDKCLLFFKLLRKNTSMFLEQGLQCDFLRNQTILRHPYLSNPCSHGNIIFIPCCQPSNFDGVLLVEREKFNIPFTMSV